MSRKIIHIDMDAFFASVEQRDNPDLRGRPVAVGGSSERGVVAAASYEARQYGVRSAMPSTIARRKCPHLIFVKPRFEVYKQVSNQIRSIFARYTPLIEPLSLDEAYLDVTGVERCRGSASLMAQEIRARIRDEVGITASAGIAPNKFIAKVASDWNKPDGQFVVRPQDVDAFVAALPVKKIFGVGKVTAARLNGLGVNTCADLRAWSVADLTREFGSFGASLHHLCRGIDERPVQPDRVRKSLSVETTYTPDLPDLDACRAGLLALLEDFHRRFERARDRPPVHKAFVKVRFSDFSRTTAECVSNAPDDAVWLRLLAEAHGRKALPVRLLGVGVRFSEDEGEAAPAQISLFDPAPSAAADGKPD